LCFTTRVTDLFLPVTITIVVIDGAADIAVGSTYRIALLTAAGITAARIAATGIATAWIVTAWIAAAWIAAAWIAAAWIAFA
jgi:hypothetical protein